MCIVWLYLMMFISGISYAAAVSSHKGAQATASSSDEQTQEYNLQRLILPIAGDRYLGADPECHGYKHDPTSIFYNLGTTAWDFTFSGAEVEQLGRFKHSHAFTQRKNGNLALTYKVPFPKLIQTMTFLGDNGLLAFDNGFYTIAAAVFRASILFARDKAINERRIENIPSLPASFNDHDTHIEGLDALPDAAMIKYFYTQLKQLPFKKREIFDSHHDRVPSNKKLFKSVEAVQELLHPFMDQVYTQVGPYAELLKHGIDDWHQAQQEFEQDVQTIQQQTKSSRWHMIIALRELFYKTNRNYHMQAPIAVTHRPTQMIDWRVTYLIKDINVTHYCPINGTLPAYFANKLFTILDSIVQGQQEMDPEKGELTKIEPPLAFDEIPPEEVMRLLHHDVFGRPASDTESAVVNIEAKLLKYLHDCLTTKLYNTIQSHPDRVFKEDILDILEHVLERKSDGDICPAVCVTQQLLDALPWSSLHELKDLLAKTPEVDEEDDAMQAYYMTRALQEQKPENFDMYLYLYNHPGEQHPNPTTAQWDHELPSVWHFMSLTRDRQKDFLLRMWQQHIKASLSAESFMKTYDCNEHCRKRCGAYFSLFRYLIGCDSAHHHYPDRMRMLLDERKRAGLLPEMKDEIVGLHREILERMYPRYKAIIQSYNKDAMNGEQERLTRYIRCLDAAGCGELIDRLHRSTDPNLTEADREELLPVVMRTYLLFPADKQQEMMQELYARHSRIAPLDALGLRLRNYLFGI